MGHPFASSPARAVQMVDGDKALSVAVGNNCGDKARDIEVGRRGDGERCVVHGGVRNCTVVGCRNLRVCNVRDALSLSMCWTLGCVRDGSRVQDGTPQDGRVFASGRQCTRCAWAFSTKCLYFDRCSLQRWGRQNRAGGMGGVVIDCGARDALMGWRMDGQGETRRLGGNETDRGDILRR